MRTLWSQTADDLMGLGAKIFYPKFTNRRVGTSPLHLGTRESHTWVHTIQPLGPHGPKQGAHTWARTWGHTGPTMDPQ